LSHINALTTRVALPTRIRVNGQTPGDVACTFRYLDAIWVLGLRPAPTDLSSMAVAVAVKPDTVSGLIIAICAAYECWALGLYQLTPAAVQKL
jgi:hypothetical protein